MNFWEYIRWLPLSTLGIIAAIFIYFALSLLVQVKKKWWFKGLLLFSCWIISFMIIYTGDIINLSFSMCFFLIILWITCKGSSLKKFTLGLMFSSAVSAFNGFYDNCLSFWAHYLGIDTLYSNMYSVGRLLFAILFYLIIKMQKPERDFELPSNLWKLMLLLALSPLGIMFSLILLRSPYMRIDGTILADSALFLLVILSFAVLLRALTVLEKQQKLERENLLAIQNQRYFQAMEQQQFEIRRLRHDLSNHLQILLALSGQQKDDYIKGMLENPSFGQILTWCGDTTFNIVLTAKEEVMRQNNIRLVTKLDIEKELPFEKADLCAILANALDNAIEACLTLTEDLREIHLNAAAGKGVLAVSIKNPCKNAADTVYTQKSGMPNSLTGTKSTQKSEIRGALHQSINEIFLKTTKKDVKNHGLGLRSIQETIKKYGGNMEIEQKNGDFHLFLYLPIHFGL